MAPQSSSSFHLDLKSLSPSVGMELLAVGLSLKMSCSDYFLLSSSIEFLSPLYLLKALLECSSLRQQAIRTQLYRQQDESSLHLPSSILAGQEVVFAMASLELHVSELFGKLRLFVLVRWGFIPAQLTGTVQLVAA